MRINTIVLCSIVALSCTMAIGSPSLAHGKGKTVPNNVQICYALLDTNNTWQPQADECNGAFIVVSPPGIFGVEIFLRGTKTNVTYDVYTTGGVLVGRGKNGGPIGNVNTPITAVDIQFGPRNLTLNVSATDNAQNSYKGHDNNVIGDKTHQLIGLQLQLSSITTFHSS